MPLAIWWSPDSDQKRNVHLRASSDEISSEDTLLQPEGAKRVDDPPPACGLALILHLDDIASCFLHPATSSFAVCLSTSL